MTSIVGWVKRKWRRLSSPRGGRPEGETEQPSAAESGRKRANPWLGNISFEGDLSSAATPNTMPRTRPTKAAREEDNSDDVWRLMASAGQVRNSTTSHPLRAALTPVSTTLMYNTPQRRHNEQSGIGITTSSVGTPAVSFAAETPSIRSASSNAAPLPASNNVVKWTRGGHPLSRPGRVSERLDAGFSQRQKRPDVAPRTPARRWNGGGGRGGDGGLGSFGVSARTRGAEGSAWRGAHEMGEMRAAQLPPGYRFGVQVIPTVTPRRLIKAMISSARYPSKLDRTHREPETLRGREGAEEPGYGMGGSHKGSGFARPVGRGRELSAQLFSLNREERELSLEKSKKEAIANRSLNDLRRKARIQLEKNAASIEYRNPDGAEQLRRDARHLENWGVEAEKGARVAAAERALHRREMLARREAQEAAERRARAKAERAAAAARAKEEKRLAAEKLAKKEEEEVRLIAEAKAKAEADRKRAAGGRRELTPEETDKIRSFWSESGDNEEIVVQAYNDVVQRKSMRTLRHGEWLGDEVINVYLKILQARNREAVSGGQPVPRCGILNSFFYTQLTDSGRGYRFAGVKRFLKKAKIDLFNLDKLIFPINVGQSHWTLAVINFRLERLEYYDSLARRLSADEFEYLVRFVDDESKSKRNGQGRDISNWPRMSYRNIPHQRNGLDCGVFTSMFADRLSKGRPLDFSQNDIGRCREMMTLAILRGERPPTEEEEALEGAGWEGGIRDENGLLPWELPQNYGEHEDEEDDEVGNDGDEFDEEAEDYSDEDHDGEFEAGDAGETDREPEDHHSVLGAESSSVDNPTQYEGIDRGDGNNMHVESGPQVVLQNGWGIRIEPSYQDGFHEEDTEAARRPTTTSLQRDNHNGHQVYETNWESHEVVNSTNRQVEDDALETVRNAFLVKNGAGLGSNWEDGLWTGQAGSSTDGLGYPEAENSPVASGGFRVRENGGMDVDAADYDDHDGVIVL